jgi:hypothetical protein
MKTKILLIVSLFLFSIISYSQKTINNTDKGSSNFEQRQIEDFLFTLIGKSKFKVITTLALKKNIKESDYMNNTDSWDKFDYLKLDSVLTRVFGYDYIDNPFFSERNPSLYLKFADDVLYNITISIPFNKESFQLCLNNYNSLVEGFGKIFPYSVPYIRTQNSKNNEQVGEGFWMYKDADEYGIPIVKEKLDKLTIGYEMNYEWDWEIGKTYTNEIDNYTLEIEYVNLLGTKLTREGY